MESQKSYNFKESEAKWQKYWEKERICAFDPKSKNKIYSIDTPPPTISGKMHLGHAFSYAQQDFIARFKRMQRFNVFYPFGTDDNGLPTERLIEKEKNVRASEMDRQEFIELCLKTLETELRPKYLADWKNIGMSCDFSIYYTTINKHCQRISQKSFVDLYKMGREYRKRTPFMWCPECQTAIAQVELKDKETKSEFVYIKFNTSINKPITIATTRPELMPACVSVHVHPNDKRYKEFIGKEVILPFFNRRVKIYANKDVDMQFGSGAVYHCTFGDMDDAKWIEKFKIEPIEIMNKDGTLNEKAGKYKGLSSKQARREIIKDLEELGLIEKIEPITHIINTHERCGTEIEILMTDQWFIRYLDLKKKFLQAGNKLKWYPKHMKTRYYNWIKGLKYDWCISRQRFFGVPFPVWYCKKCGEIILSDESQLPVDPLKDSPKKYCRKCGSKEFLPEKDVLDTWATSSLTPQITASLFPKIYKKLYPMSLRPQSHDIISFWLVNTLVKSQLHNNINPWKEVVISGWVLDPYGKKMSKSKGNIIEPRDAINKYGADALRYWAASSKIGEDLPFQEKELVAGQKFLTKLWNASKFTIMQLQDYTKEKPKLTLIDKWMLSKLNNSILKATKHYDNYKISEAKKEIEQLFWHTFCDNYIEIIKDRIYNKSRSKEDKLATQFTLYESLLSFLKLFSPIMPHITEEIYQNYFIKFEKDKSIHISEFPEANKKLIYKKAEEIGDLFVSILSEVRQFKNKNQKSLKAEITLTLEKKYKDKLKDVLEDLKAVTYAKEIIFADKFDIKF